MRQVVPSAVLAVAFLVIAVLVIGVVVAALIGIDALITVPGAPLLRPGERGRIPGEGAAALLQHAGAARQPGPAT